MSAHILENIALDRGTRPDLNKRLRRRGQFDLVCILIAFLALFNNVWWMFEMVWVCLWDVGYVSAVLTMFIYFSKIFTKQLFVAPLDVVNRLLPLCLQGFFAIFHRSI